MFMLAVLNIKKNDGSWLFDGASPYEPRHVPRAIH